MSTAEDLTDYRARVAAESYQDILDRDTRPVPDFLRDEQQPFLGLEPVAASRYTSQDFFDRECEKLWPQCWQMACREEEIPNVGDYVVYEVVGLSAIIVRSGPDEIKALINSCLHRGRKLATADGCAEKFRCPYHGFTWNIDGSFREQPFGWDFPQIREDAFSLPEAKVGRWAGFVFINFDPQAEPLEAVLGILPEHLARSDYDNRYKAVHVAKVINANWKVVSEAFMESHHTIDTHPQIMPYLADVNSQYDVYSDFVSRQISAVGVPSPHLDLETVSQQEIIDVWFGMDGRTGGAQGEDAHRVPDGMTARAFGAETMRAAYAAQDGHDYSGYSDAEMLDAMLYNVFPNISIWAGAMPTLVYRWRPYGRDVNRTIMDVMIMMRRPADGSTPPVGKMRMLGADEPWTDAPEIGGLGYIFNQDTDNLPFVQEGLIASRSGAVQLSNYQESRLRLHHQTLDKFLDR